MGLYNPATRTYREPGPRIDFTYSLRSGPEWRDVRIPPGTAVGQVPVGRRFDVPGAVPILVVDPKDHRLPAIVRRTIAESLIELRLSAKVHVLCYLEEPADRGDLAFSRPWRTFPDGRTDGGRPSIWIRLGLAARNRGPSDLRDWMNQSEIEALVRHECWHIWCRATGRHDADEEQAADYFAGVTTSATLPPGFRGSAD